jgi:hypothetical protein
MEKLDYINLLIEKKIYNKSNKNKYQYIVRTYQYLMDKCIEEIYEVDTNDYNIVALENKEEIMNIETMFDDIHNKCKHDRFNMVYDRETPIDNYLIVKNKNAAKNIFLKQMLEIIDKFYLLLPQDDINIKKDFATNNNSIVTQKLHQDQIEHQELIPVNVQQGGYNFLEIPELHDPINGVSLDVHDNARVLSYLSSRIYEDSTNLNPFVFKKQKYNSIEYDSNNDTAKQKTYLDKVRIQTYKSEKYGMMGVSDFIVVARGTKTPSDLLADIGIYNYIEKSIELSKNNTLDTNSLLDSVKYQLHGYVTQQTKTGTISSTDAQEINKEIDASVVISTAARLGSSVGWVASFGINLGILINLNSNDRRDLNTVNKIFKNVVSVTTKYFTSEQFISNIFYIKETIDNIYKKYSYIISPNIYLTGHSLAGGLINLIGYKFKMSSYAFNPIGLKFFDEMNIPNIAEIASPKILTNILVGIAEHVVSIYDTIVIRNTYDLVSGINPYVNIRNHPHFGKIYNCDLDNWIEKIDLPSLLPKREIEVERIPQSQGIFGAIGSAVGAVTSATGSALGAVTGSVISNTGSFLTAATATVAGYNSENLTKYANLLMLLSKHKEIIVINHRMKYLQNYINLIYYLRLYFKSNGIPFNKIIKNLNKPENPIIKIKLTQLGLIDTAEAIQKCRINIKTEDFETFNKIVVYINNIPVEGDIPEETLTTIQALWQQLQVILIPPVVPSIDGAIGGYINQDKYYKKYLKYKQKYMLLKNKI